MRPVAGASVACRGPRGSIAARSGSLDAARRSLLGAAGPAGDQDPEAASRIVAEAVTLAFNLADAGVAAAAGTRATVLLAGDLFVRRSRAGA